MSMQMQLLDYQKWFSQSNGSSCPLGKMYNPSNTILFKSKGAFKGVVENLDRIQHMVARYILQLPKSSARVAGALDAGFMKMKDRVAIRTVMFVWNILNKKPD